MPREEKELGHVVVDGCVRYTSVSAIEKFDLESEGGCHMKWWLKYVKREKEIRKGSQTLGVVCHAELEQYLKTGENVLSPITLAGRHLLPAPGKDLIIEADFGDIERALALRDKRSPAAEIERAAGLAAGDVPLLGYIDVRHCRGMFVNSEGSLCVEKFDGTIEVIDHKTTSSIEAYAKRPTQLLDSVQMVGYAKYTFNTNPNAKYVRLSHIYYQTRGAKEASKRTVLIGRQETEEKWGRIVGVVEEMKRVAAITDHRHVEKNLGSCKAYGGCGLSHVCPKSPIEIAKSLFSSPPTSGGGRTMGSMLDRLHNRPADADTDTQLPASSTLVVSLPNATPANAAADAAARQLAIDAEKEKLRAEDAAGTAVAGKIPVTACDMDEFYVVDGKTAKFVGASKGLYFFLVGDDRIRLESDAYVVPCKVEVMKPATAATTIATSSVGQVNPPDAPKYDLTDAADPLPEDVINQIIDPELRKRAEEHAKKHTERKAAEAAAAGDASDEPDDKGGGGRCPEGKDKKRIVCTDDQIATKQYKCSCGKTLKLKLGKNNETGKYEATIPGHNLPKAEEKPAAGSTNTTTTTAASTASSTSAAGSTSQPAVSSPNGGHEAPGTGSRQLDLPKTKEEISPSISTTSSTVAVPSSSTIFNPDTQHVVLFVDVTVEGADGLKPLENYFTPFLRDIEAEWKTVDVRVSPKDSPLAFGAWKGVLAAVVRDRLPEPGGYVIYRPGEIAEVVIEALKPHAVVIRGAR